ncbi:hypothetical protein FEDK69T_30470 [Flavobacterium enshiense DK69]|uniref:Uncharacterized protein n=1 Tax=Flavobacterium enshiense DK69 TaxID=1107311 RepID=V6S1E0_9FLAO|nr:STM3941 family protein [Flavobacterium enshiense]ESU20194.1 hypothetical protein FEDK69T_30470 [Flavobacterium enshiense DK69]KGO92615.1 hypothetical protein Q767_15585 [Flavobacterium enshiense DK69]
MVWEQKSPTPQSRRDVMGNFMNEQQNNQFHYYPIKLWVDSTITIIIFISFTLLLVINKNQPFGVIIALLIWIFFGSHFFKTINNLKRHINNKPAIELTDGYFFDHINNIKIYWKNIKKINLIEIRGNTYIGFDLKDVNSYVIQSTSLMTKFLFKLKLQPEKLLAKTEISLVKGKNEEIIEEINKFYQYKSYP